MMKMMTMKPIFGWKNQIIANLNCPKISVIYRDEEDFYFNQEMLDYAL